MVGEGLQEGKGLPFHPSTGTHDKTGNRKQCGEEGSQTSFGCSLDPTQNLKTPPQISNDRHNFKCQGTSARLFQRGDTALQAQK